VPKIVGFFGRFSGKFLGRFWAVFRQLLCGFCVSDLATLVQINSQPPPQPAQEAVPRVSVSCEVSAPRDSVASQATVGSVDSASSFRQ